MNVFSPRLFLLPVLLVLLQACGGGSSSSSSGVGGYTVSGSFSVPANTAIDSDLNDEFAAYRNNDSVADAQPIPNPVILGGYVNQPNQGPDGRSRYSGDLSDSFRVSLRRGQVVQLFIAAENLRFNDLDLLLLDSQGGLVSSSQNQGNTEVIEVPADGWYVIQVQAFAGASNYVLSLGQSFSGSSAPLGGLSLGDDFVPGEVTVTLAQRDTLGIQSLDALAARFNLQAKGGDSSRRMLFALKDDSALQTMSADPLLREVKFRDAEQREKFATLLTIKRLRARADIAEAAPNYRFHAAATPNDKLYRYQWHYSMLDLPQAWDVSTGSRDVIVAVIDTGVLLNHPDLQGKLVAGYDFITDTGTSLDGDGRDANPNDPGDQSATGSSFHGTHVAGTIGALTNNSIGGGGVGWNTRVMPLRVLGLGGSGDGYDIEQAIRYAAGLSNDSGTLPAQRADIINLSLGGPRIGASFQQVIDQVRAQGVMVVAAAGNDGRVLTHYPAGLNGVVSVAAVNMNRQRASYSNISPTVDVAAPGGDNTPDINGDGLPDGIISTLGDDSQGGVRYIYASQVGTSMATPHVAGVMALMKAVNPALSPADFDGLLNSGDLTIDLGDRGHDSSYGHGLLNAHRAVLAALSASAAPPPAAQPQLSVIPGGLNFGLSNTQLDITLTNSGGGELVLTGISDTSGGRLGLVRNQVDGNGLGSYTVTLNRENQPPGTYSAEMIFSTSHNQVTVPLIWQITDLYSEGAGDAGFQYVLLVDPDTLQTRYQVETNVSNGLYYFNFSGIEAGEYIIITGSDNNRDLQICDAGEACGAFLTLEKPSVLEVQRSIPDLHFSVGFNTDFLSASAVYDLPIPAPRRQGYDRIVLRSVVGAD